MIWSQLPTRGELRDYFITFRVKSGLIFFLFIKLTAAAIYEVDHHSWVLTPGRTRRENVLYFMNITLRKRERDPESLT